MNLFFFSLMQRRLLVALFTTLVLSNAWGQTSPPPCCPGPTCPNGSVKVVVPFAPGGSIDITARILAAKLSKEFGQAYIADNIPGNGGILGANKVASENWKNTIFVGGSEVLINPLITKSASYTLATNLHPASMLAENPYVLVASRDTKARTLAELRAAALSNGSQIRAGHSGSGSAGHILIAQALSLAGIKVTQLVAFKGVAPLANALESNEVQVAALPYSAAQAQISSGRVSAIAVFTSSRLSFLPGIPTLKEAGIAAPVPTVWIGVFAVGESPPSCTRSLGMVAMRVMAAPDVREQIKQMGFLAPTDDPGAWTKDISTQQSQWGSVIRAQNVRAE